MPELNNRIALVTGGSRGIGRAIALALANVGVGVAVNYRERAEEAASVVEGIHQSGGKAVAVGADVSVASSVQSMVSAIEEQLGPIDILVNNAGIAPMCGIDDITEGDFDRTIAVNLKSAFLCTQAVLPGMRESNNTRSGCSREKLSSACAPSSAAATTSMSGSLLIKAARPIRTM